MSCHDLVGWQLLHKLIENDIKTEADIIVAITHWFLIKQGSFLCLGLGDQKTLADGEEGTELLPGNWNTDKTGSYSLRYVYNNTVYVLLVTISGDTIILNLLSSSSLDVSNIALNIKDVVKSLTGPLQTIVPDVASLTSRLKKDLLEPVRTSSNAETQTPTLAPELSRPDPIPLLQSPDLLRIHPRVTDPLRDIGRGDLDPFGRGGGMLFNPPGMHPLPDGIGPIPGRIPGARFDPFNPIPGPGRFGRSEPNPDHLRPPGYDDMFM